MHVKEIIEYPVPLINDSEVFKAKYHELNVASAFWVRFDKWRIAQP